METKIDLISNLIQKKKFKEAKIKCEEIIEKNTNNFVFLNIFAIVLFQLNEFDNAEKKWKQSIKINPQYFDAYSNLINAFLNLEKYEDALNIILKAIEIAPQNHELHHKLGGLFFKKNKIDKALEAFEKALKIKKDYIPSLRSKVILLRRTNKSIEALKELDKLLIYDKDKFKVYMQKASIYISLRNPIETIINMKKAYSINPNAPFIYGDIIHEKTKMCDWSDFDKEIHKMKEKIDNNEKVLAPFVATTLFDSPELQLKVSERWINGNEINVNDYVTSEKKNKKIKIGYFSAEFRSHAMGYLMNRIYDLHDRSTFELYGFYFGPAINHKDKLQKKIIDSFDRFIDVSQFNDTEIFKLSKEIGIDIGIDLMGHTGGNTNRFTIFQKKIAPIQICFLGFPCTTGSKSIDYLIADKIGIPKKFKKF